MAFILSYLFKSRGLLSLCQSKNKIDVIFPIGQEGFF